MIQELKDDKNFYVVEGSLNILSVFDHTNYDRSDLDLLSGPQRQYVEKKLKKHGYKFKTGRVLQSKTQSIVFRIPKQSIISANPFDIIRYEKRDQGDIFVLTPTQSACLIINRITVKDELKLALKELIKKQPINLKKIYDNIRFEKSKENYQSIHNELSEFQSEVIKSTHLKYKQHLGKLL